jgi:hypothetical protein
MKGCTSKVLGLAELREYVARWETVEAIPDDAYGVCKCIGYLRRESLRKEETALLRETELLVRRNLELALRLFGEYAEGFLLREYAENLRDDLDEDAIEQFHQMRDEAQMVVELLWEYVEEDESLHQLAPLGNMQSYLLGVDSLLLWDKRIVKAIQGLAVHSLIPPALDTGLYWWWGKSAYESGCWVPDHFKNSWFAAEIQGLLRPEEKAAMNKHVAECSQCEEALEWLWGLAREKKIY